MPKFDSVDDYIASFDSKTQKRLEAIRKIVNQEAPKATEKISYGIPYYSLNGRLVYFAAFKDHVSLFPASSSAREAFKKELAGYGTSKGTIRFSYEMPLPLALIRKIIKFRVKENQAKKG